MNDAALRQKRDNLIISDQVIHGKELENCVPYHKEDYGACAVSIRS